MGGGLPRGTERVDSLSHGKRLPASTENSGGIDSASVTAYLARMLGEPGDRLHCFGLALNGEEPSFILKTSQHANIVHNYLIGAWSISDEGLTAPEWRGLQVLGYPEEHGGGSQHIQF